MRNLGKQKSTRDTDREEFHIFFHMRNLGKQKSTRDTDREGRFGKSSGEEKDTEGEKMIRVKNVHIWECLIDIFNSYNCYITTCLYKSKKLKYLIYLFFKYLTLSLKR
jgi:hypothetical protein